MTKRRHDVMVSCGRTNGCSIVGEPVVYPFGPRAVPDPVDRCGLQWLPAMLVGAILVLVLTIRRLLR